MQRKEPRFPWLTDTFILWTVGIIVAILLAFQMTRSDVVDLKGDKQEFYSEKMDDERQRAAVRCVAERMAIATAAKQKGPLAQTPDCKTTLTVPKPEPT